MSSFTTAKSVVLKSIVEEGMPGPEHFDIVETQINMENIPEKSVLLQVLVMSADPYLRGSIKSTGFNKPGRPLNGYVAGKVISSNSALYHVGDLIGSNLPFSSIQIVTEDHLTNAGTWKLNGIIDEANISYGIGILGMPGSTAYGGLLDVLRPKEGETIFISAASGAVGGLVGMLAKQLFNCKVIGSCGGVDKCALVKEFYGFDHAIDYKAVNSAEDLVAQLRAVAPEGIDMYFENVGGIHFDAAMEVLRPFGRVAVCGQISEYNSKVAAKSAFNPLKMIYTNQRIEGFVCTRWLKGETGNFLQDMSKWLQEGKVKVQETTFEGVEQWPLAFQSLFTGRNVGKVVVRV